MPITLSCSQIAPAERTACEPMRACTQTVARGPMMTCVPIWADGEMLANGWIAETSRIPWAWMISAWAAPRHVVANRDHDPLDAGPEQLVEAVQPTPHWEIGDHGAMLGLI